MSDPTGLYRTEEGRYLHVSTRGPDLVLRVFDEDLQDAMLPAPVARAQLDHEVRRGRWARVEAPSQPRVVVAGSRGFGQPAVVLGDVAGPGDRLPDVRVIQTPLGVTAKVHWQARGAHISCPTFHASNINDLHLLIRAELQAWGWLFVEVPHG